MSEIDPRRAARECERACKGTTDPHVRSILTALRDLWIELEEESSFLDPDQLASHAVMISSIQARFTAPTGQTIH